MLLENKLCTDNEVTIEFDPYSFYVKDLKSKEVKLLRINAYRLYKLYGSTLSNFPNGDSSNIFHVSLELWHERLGHSSFSTIKRVVNKYGDFNSNFAKK